MIWNILYTTRNRQWIDRRAVRGLFRGHTMEPVVLKMPPSVHMNVLVPQKFFLADRGDGANWVVLVHDAKDMVVPI